MLNILLFLIFATVPAFGQQAAQLYEGKLEVVFEPDAKTPFEQEMILITVRGVYPHNISLETLVRPDFGGVGWMELGSDYWFAVNDGGIRRKGFERKIALFPQTSGPVTIGSFVHKLTFATPEGARVAQDFLSAPVTIDVLARPAGEGAWMPARGVSVSESWDIDPEQLAPGEAAVRTVTVEAVGLGAEALPPAPEMRAKGLMTFFDGEERSHRITPDGPVSQVVWRWTVRPSSSEPAMLEPVTIPWFNTVSRRSDDIVITPQRVAVFQADAFGRSSVFETESLQKYAVPIGVLIGLLGGLLAIFLFLRTSVRQP